MTRTQSKLALIAGLCASLLGCGDKEDPSESASRAEVLDPAEEHYGKAYSEWNAEWFKWIYQMPLDDDCHLPVDDTTGEYCDASQPEDMFFLAGYVAPSGKAVVVRKKCVAPADVPLFFPLMNTVADNGGIPVEDQFPDEENQATVADSVDRVLPENLFASVNGEEIGNLEQFKTDVVEFSYELPDEPNFYTCTGAPGVTGTITPSYSGGFYVMLAPLPAGTHTIRFGLDQADDLWASDVTYELTVR